MFDYAWPWLLKGPIWVSCLPPVARLWQWAKGFESLWVKTLIRILSLALFSLITLVFVALPDHDFFNGLLFAGHLLVEASPFLLIALILVVGIKTKFSGSAMALFLGGSGAFAILGATVFGVPLVICSCAIVPIAYSLVDAKCSKGVVSAFMISTPESGPDSISLSYKLLGLPLTIARVTVAMITAFVTGLLVGSAEKRIKREIYPKFELGKKSFDTHSKKLGFKQAVRYAFIEMPDDFAVIMYYSFLLSGLMMVYLTPELLSSMGLTGGFWSTLLGMLLILLISIPTYVCATESTPIAASMLAVGFSPGAVLVFLIAGPATNVLTFKFALKALGLKTSIVFFSSIAVCTLLGGIATDWIFAAYKVASGTDGKASGLFPEWFYMASTLVMVSISILAIVDNRIKGQSWNHQGCCNKHA